MRPFNWTNSKLLSALTVDVLNVSQYCSCTTVVGTHSILLTLAQSVIKESILKDTNDLFQRFNV